MTVLYSHYVRAIAIRNGLDPARCRIARYFVSRANQPVPRGHTQGLCYVGRLTKLKGVDIALMALADLPETFTLSIIGDGYHRHALERLAGRLNVSHRVQFHGWQGPQTSVEAMTQADLVVVPSIWPEPFGIVGLEAMSVGRATVASDTGGVREWLEDGVTGHLVPPGDPDALRSVISRLFSEPDRLDQMGRASWERAAEFSEERHVEGMIRLYREVADGRRSGDSRI